MSDDRRLADAQVPVDVLHELVQRFEPRATLVRQWALAGGVSATTNAIEVRDAGGSAKRYVVRVYGERDFASNPRVAEHEFRLLEYLVCAGLPVPRPVSVLEPGEVFERPSIVIEFIDGDLIGDPTLRAKYLDQFTMGLVRIHNLDLSAFDLSFLSNSRKTLNEPVDTRSEDTSLSREIANILMERWPVKSCNQPVLLHGDYWRGNLLWRNGELVGIVDWEDASIGDPLADVARARAELYWSVSSEACEEFAHSYLDQRAIDTELLPLWDLRMALGLAREMPNWGLERDRERQATQALTHFVRSAHERMS